MRAAEFQPPIVLCNSISRFPIATKAILARAGRKFGYIFWAGKRAFNRANLSVRAQAHCPGLALINGSLDGKGKQIWLNPENPDRWQIRESKRKVPRQAEGQTRPSEDRGFIHIFFFDAIETHTSLSFSQLGNPI